jgi:GMP synthase-like glutamine amidotransferase
MRVLAISHQRDAGPGVFADAIDEAGGELDVWRLAETDEPPADPFGYDGVISLGGGMHVDQDGQHPWIAAERALLAELLAGGRPLLGACLGAQLLVQAAGGDSRRANAPEIGWYPVELTPDGAEDPLLGPLAPRFEAFQWHSYDCLPPDDAVTLARSAACVQAFRIGARAWGLQFHAEVSAADAAGWIDHYHTDADAVRIGVDPAALHAETAPRIDAFNELGRELCARWLAAVEPGG